LPDLEVIEILEFTLMLIGILLFLLNCRKKPELFIWLPAFLALTFGFLFTNLEAIFAYETFNFLEHLSYLMMAIFFFYAVISTYYQKIHQKGKEIP